MESIYFGEFALYSDYEKLPSIQGLFLSKDASIEYFVQNNGSLPIDWMSFFGNKEINLEEYSKEMQIKAIIKGKPAVIKHFPPSHYHCDLVDAAKIGGCVIGRYKAFDVGAVYDSELVKPDDRIPAKGIDGQMSEGVYVLEPFKGETFHPVEGNSYCSKLAKLEALFVFSSGEVSVLKKDNENGNSLLVEKTPISVDDLEIIVCQPPN